MATAEGTFPKVGGDPLYYSEVNRSPRVYIGGTFSQTGSFALPQSAGSFLISGNSFAGSDTQILTVNLLSLPGNASLMVELSGTSIGNYAPIFSGGTFGQSAGQIIMNEQAQTGSTQIVTSAIFRNGTGVAITVARLANLHASGANWVLFSLQNAATGSTTVSYSLVNYPGVLK